MRNLSFSRAGCREVAQLELETSGTAEHKLTKPRDSLDLRVSHAASLSRRARRRSFTVYGMYYIVLSFFYAISSPSNATARPYRDLIDITSLRPQASTSATLAPKHGAHDREDGSSRRHGHVGPSHEGRAYCHGVRLPPPAHRRGEGARLVVLGYLIV